MELNAEQIKKALKEMNMTGVSPTAIRNALALITSQEQRIAELTEENEGLITDNTILKQKRMNIFEIGDAYDRGKIKGVRQMQERLTSCFCPDCDYSGHDVQRVIDQIAKEMLEGENNG